MFSLIQADPRFLCTHMCVSECTYGYKGGRRLGKGEEMLRKGERAKGVADGKQERGPEGTGE